MPASRALIQHLDSPNFSQTATHAGFEIAYQWQPGKGKGVFIVAKKQFWRRRIHDWTINLKANTGDRRSIIIKETALPTVDSHLGHETMPLWIRLACLVRHSLHAETHRIVQA